MKKLDEVTKNALLPVITSKGLEAALAASTLGKPAKITHVGLTEAPGYPSEEMESLPGESLRLKAEDGTPVSPHQVSVSVLLREENPGLSIHGVGFYLEDGTLFAVYQSPHPLLNHTAGTQMLVAMDVVMGNIPAGSITVEATGANLDLGGFVKLTRKVNGYELARDITLTAADVKAAPAGFGLGEETAFFVADLNSDPRAWNGGKIGFFRTDSSTLGLPEEKEGLGLLTRLRGTSSAFYVQYTGSDGIVRTRRYESGNWVDWSTVYSTDYKPTANDLDLYTKSEINQELDKRESPIAKDSLTPRSLSVRFSDAYHSGDFGAIGDGVTDNNNAFSAAEDVTSELVLGDGTFYTSIPPSLKLSTRSGGKLKLGTQIYQLSSLPQAISPFEQVESDGTAVRMSNLTIGQDCAPSLGNTDSSYANTIIGTSSLQKATPSAEMKRITALGGFSGRDLKRAYSLELLGTSAMEWSNYADRVTLIGANAGKNLGSENPVGRHLYFNPANPDPQGWDARWPEWREFAGAVDSPKETMTSDKFGTKATHLVGVGRNTFGFSITASDSAALGYDAATSLLYGTNVVAVGDRSMQWTIDANQSTWVGGKSAQALMSSFQDTGVGAQSGTNYVKSRQNSVFGYQAMAGLQSSLSDVPELNCFFGRISGANAVGSIKHNAGFGASTLLAVRSDGNAAFGTGALQRLNDESKGNNTALGTNSLIQMQDNTNALSMENCTGVGYQTRVSGDNQVQLGNSSATTYVYGTVQNRSDARDKTDVRDTELGIDFIMGLRPVDGRWDMREDYHEVDGNEVRSITKDGSKSRKRFHHWFIAQEVKELCDRLGVDFGGYQDHSVNGGCDVLSLGYDEFIPPTVKAVQECWNKISSLDERIKLLEQTRK